MANSIFYCGVLLLTAIFSITTAAVYAQETGMVQPTSNGTLDVSLQPTWSDGGKASFNVAFFNPGTTTPHQHQDYDFKILKGDQVIFSAANQTGQSVLHNVEGTLTVPYTFQENGNFTVQVHLAGTGVGPTIPTDENATFSVNVVPEFPIGILGIALGAVMTTGVVIVKKLKLA
jgi:hypothetical protein